MYTHARFSIQSMWMLPTKDLTSIILHEMRIGCEVLFLFGFWLLLIVVIECKMPGWVCAMWIHIRWSRKQTVISKSKSWNTHKEIQQNFSISIRAIDCISDFQTLEWIPFACCLYWKLDYEISRFDWHSFCHLCFVSGSAVHLFIHIHHHQIHWQKPSVCSNLFIVIVLGSMVLCIFVLTDVARPIPTKNSCYFRTQMTMFSLLNYEISYDYRIRLPFQNANTH